MNIFHLHKDPKTCARYHCDKHVVKMILETGQMLSTAYRRHFGNNDDLYQTAYPRHPMTVWVGNSGGNFSWTIKLLDYLLQEYDFRFNQDPNKTKIHSTIHIYNFFITKHKYWQDLTGDFTKPPLCMPDKYKCDDYIQSYRKYYIGDKKRFAKYTAVDFPEFLC